MSTEALKLARDALEEIALAGMSGTGEESPEAMNAWHARRAREFIGIAARALDTVRAALAAAAPSQKPFGHFVYIATEQRGEFVHDLDEAIDDLTNCECEVTDLYEHPAPAGGAEPVAVPEGWKLILVNEGFDGLMDSFERAHRKGYMPDAITEDYEGFDYRDATHTAQPQPQPEPSQEFNRGWDAAIEAHRLPYGAARRQDHDWHPRELQEEHGEVTLPFAEFKRLVAAQPEEPAEPSDVLSIPADWLDAPSGILLDKLSLAAGAAMADAGFSGLSRADIAKCNCSNVGRKVVQALARFARRSPAPVAQQPAVLSLTEKGEWETFRMPEVGGRVRWIARRDDGRGGHEFILNDSGRYSSAKRFISQDAAERAILKAQGGRQ